MASKPWKRNRARGKWKRSLKRWTRAVIRDWSIADCNATSNVESLILRRVRDATAAERAHAREAASIIRDIIAEQKAHLRSMKDKHRFPAIGGTGTYRSRFERGRRYCTIAERFIPTNR
tara:strand:- start:342 stop:698 length:357 start_codon:yes stop_codon:yes gene_type:complete